MVFADFSSAQQALLWSTFGVAVVLGAVVNKTNFCTMGAVSDWVNMGDTGRFRAWTLAIAVAILGVLILEASGLVNVTDTFPPYRAGTLIWAENVLGGFMFGIGMTLASGCGNKCLVRIGGGNLKSVVVLLVIGVIAYFMINPFPGSDKTLMSELFIPWIRDAAVTLKGGQDLGSLVSIQHAATARMFLGGGLAVLLLVYIFRSADFRRNFDNVLGGLVVGLAVVGAWYISGNVQVQANLLGEEQIVTLDKYVANWSLYQDDMGMMEDEAIPAQQLVRPAEARSLNSQSFTFINPMGQTLGYAWHRFDSAYLTFGVMALVGVIAGSLLWSILSGGFRIEWFASFGDFAKHFIGAVLMGFGGVLAVGCTIGQGVTGISTLALGSFLAFFSIVFGSALTMKVQYYKMVYEEASFGAVLITSLVDMRLLPGALRRLEAV